MKLLVRHWARIDKERVNVDFVWGGLVGREPICTDREPTSLDENWAQWKGQGAQLIPKIFDDRFILAYCGTNLISDRWFYPR
jgi:hypothetical protein